jgi:hypothetical protein
MDLFFVFPFHSEKVRSLLLATYGCHEYCNSFQRPLSLLRLSILWSLFSTKALKVLKAFRVWLLSLKKYSHVFLVKSSMKVRRYLLIVLEVVGMGPQRSLWINCSGRVVAVVFLFGTRSYCILSITHDSQICFTRGILEVPATRFLLVIWYKLW